MAAHMSIRGQTRASGIVAEVDDKRWQLRSLEWSEYTAYYHYFSIIDMSDMV
jgi:hypothetical protein